MVTRFCKETQKITNVYSLRNDVKHSISYDSFHVVCAKSEPYFILVGQRAQSFPICHIVTSQCVIIKEIGIQQDLDKIRHNAHVHGIYLAINFLLFGLITSKINIKQDAPRGALLSSWGNKNCYKNRKNYKVYPRFFSFARFLI